MLPKFLQSVLKICLAPTFNPVNLRILFGWNTIQFSGWLPLLTVVCMSLRIWWSSWMPTAASALWFSSSLPGVSFQLDWPLTSMPCLGFFPACTSWHWMPLSTAGEACVCACMWKPLHYSDLAESLSLNNHSLRHHISSVVSIKVKIILFIRLLFCTIASLPGLGLWQYPTSSYSRGPNPWLVSTTQTELWRCSPLSSLTKQVCILKINLMSFECVLFKPLFLLWLKQFAFHSCLWCHLNSLI